MTTRSTRETGTRPDQCQPVMPDQHEDVARERQRIEQQQRPALAPAVCQPSARIGIDRTKQCLQCVEQADDQHACTESLKILRREAEPETFALLMMGLVAVGLARRRPKSLD